MHSLKVLIVSEKNNLVDYLEKKLTDKGCEVFFEKKVKKIEKKIREVDYLIYFDNLKINFEKTLSIIKSSPSYINIKLVFVFPFSQNKKYFDETTTKLKKLEEILKDLAGVVFLGEVYDLEKNFWPNFLSDSVLSYISHKPACLKFSKKDLLYPLSTLEASEILVKLLFSLRIYGKKIAILGRPIDSVFFLRYLRKRFGNKKIYFSENCLFRHRVTEKFYAKEPKRQVLRSTVNHLLQKKGNQTRHFWEENKKDGKLKLLVFVNWKVKIISLFFFLTTLPFFLFVFSLSFLFLADKTFGIGYLSLTDRFLDYSFYALEASEKFSRIFTKGFYLKGPYLVILDSSGVLKKEIKIGKKFLDLVESSGNFLFNLTNDKEYDLALETGNLSLEFENLYKEIGFLDGEIGVSAEFTKATTRLFFIAKDPKKLREKFLLAGRIISNLGPALGKEKPRRYLLVFQNNDKLRASGGRIEALIFVLFSNGKVSEVNVFSTKEVDQKLNGLVEPPQRLKKYFGSKSWYLKDANWFPGFPESAKQIEWFIDKELQEEIDGVLAVDFTTLSRVLGVLGKVEEFEKVAESIKETDRYPLEGDESVSNFLKKVLEERKSLNKFKLFRVLRELILALDKKGIQVYLKDNDLEKTFSQAGWDGSLTKNSCSGNCYPDTLSLVEATILGESGKIKREYELEVSLEEGLVKRRLFVFMENISKSPYSFYTRLVVPMDSGFSKVNVVKNDSQEEKALDVLALGDFKDAGVSERLEVGEAKVLIFSWESEMTSSYKKDGEYSLRVFKQPGIASPPFQIKVKFPEGFNLQSSYPPTLTSSGEVEYNTLLSRDFLSRIFWRKQI